MRFQIIFTILMPERSFSNPFISALWANFLSDAISVDTSGHFFLFFSLQRFIVTFSRKSRNNCYSKEPFQTSFLAINKYDLTK